MAGKSASLTFRLVLRAAQPITMSKMFLVASAMATPTSTSTSHNMLKYLHAQSHHIRNHLARALRGAYCRAIGDCDFKSEMPQGVVYSRRAAEYIRGFKTPIIKPVQVPEVVSAIEEWQGTLSDNQISDHVANLKNRHAAVKEGANPLCPLCGGKMVLRKRRSDNKSFYGCERYPACRGIKNVE